MLSAPAASHRRDPLAAVVGGYERQRKRMHRAHPPLHYPDYHTVVAGPLPAPRRVESDSARRQSPMGVERDALRPPSAQLLTIGVF